MKKGCLITTVAASSLGFALAEKSLAVDHGQLVQQAKQMFVEDCGQVKGFDLESFGIESYEDAQLTDLIAQLEMNVSTFCLPDQVGGEGPAQSVEKVTIKK